MHLGCYREACLVFLSFVLRYTNNLAGTIHGAGLYRDVEAGNYLKAETAAIAAQVVVASCLE